MFKEARLDTSEILPKRQIGVHKGQCGKIGIIAGSLTMLGAAVLTARAALRSGAGLVYLFTVPEAVPYINSLYPEIIVLPLKSKHGFLAHSSFNLVQNYLQDLNIDCLAIGPGLGRKDYTCRFVRKIIRANIKENLPMVIDADALFALDKKFLNTVQNEQLILTPHPGEFQRLFNVSLSSKDKDRQEKLAQVIKDTNNIVLLKGHNSLIGYANKYYVNKTGNPGMATAGAGDVLTGMIAAFISLKISRFDAVCLSANLHGKAGDMAYKKNNIGLIASDIIACIPEAIKNN
jgi:hydroxyethylthiazole kinase-like uncharacterized protein yjeF